MCFQNQAAVGKYLPTKLMHLNFYHKFGFDTCI